MRSRVTLLALALTASFARAQAPLYLVDTPFDPPNAATIYEVDPTTGAMTTRAVLGHDWSPLLGLAAADGRTLYASGTDNAGTVCAGSTFGCVLLRIVLAPGSTAPESVEVVGPIVHGTTPLAGVSGMTFRSDGTLYVVSQDDHGLYTLDPTTARAAFVGTSTVALHGGDLTFDGEDRLLLWSNGLGSGAGLYELDPATAVATWIDSESGVNLSGLAALGHSNDLYGANTFADRLHDVDPVTGFTGATAPLRLDGAPFDHKRGDLDSPYCVDDAACDDLDPCTVDRCTAGGCRHAYEDATCDGIDDDCDGEVDEDGDPDGDGVPACFDNCPLASNGDQENADGDGGGDACDCAPSDPANAPPPEVGPTLVASRDGEAVALAWSDGAPSPRFNVYRGVRRPGIPWDYNQSCIAPSIPEPAADDGLTPLPGHVFFYVVSRIGCGESVLARDGAGQAIPNPDPCPGTGADADGDGVEEAIDTCPGLANPDQADADGDGIGDACE